VQGEFKLHRKRMNEGDETLSPHFNSLVLLKSKKPSNIESMTFRGIEGDYHPPCCLSSRTSRVGSSGGWCHVVEIARNNTFKHPLRQFMIFASLLRIVTVKERRTSVSTMSSNHRLNKIVVDWHGIVVGPPTFALFCKFWKV
jgi:hypothetical protein